MTQWTSDMTLGPAHEKERRAGRQESESRARGPEDAADFFCYWLPVLDLVLQVLISSLLLTVNYSYYFIVLIQITLYDMAPTVHELFGRASESCAGGVSLRPRVARRARLTAPSNATTPQLLRRCTSPPDLESVSPICLAFCTHLSGQY
jgi:hypothetical protein